jgi:hypothetical protein
MTTSYAKSINKTEGPTANGCIVTKKAGSTITAGQSVKLSSGNVIPCTAITDVFYGVALEAIATDASGKIARTGCLVDSGATIAADGWVEPSTTGGLQAFTTGTKVGICEKAATSASLVRLL